MNTVGERHRHALICGVLTAMAVALAGTWFLLSDLDPSTRAAQLGAMIAVVAAAPAASAAWSCRRRDPHDDKPVAAVGAVTSRQ